ncbi:GNAT family N-acetyltransferase [Rhodocytophaga aerolata]|uniref:GNAT family N-acetyltransferase n=1 Tax=Rhodocytophaga aerolata TaxID=455078 RepID=A0ABT8QY06_9BACT|nr:GNAT family N-acetyltransferase [Rhodocytophaga aerolata]MDO1444725.1 GNAT family N-acetyltransferase [Rhodocytophaga aerolata]
MLTYVPHLLTSRLVLRHLSLEDKEQLLPISFYNGKPLHTLDEIVEKLRKIDADIDAGNTIHWGIALKPEGTIIGTIGFYRGFRDNTGEIGYVLNEKFRGHGFMQEAIKAVLQVGFNQLLLDQVIAYTGLDNTASSKVLQTAGFTETASDQDQYRKWIIYK